MSIAQQMADAIDNGQKPTELNNSTKGRSIDMNQETKEQIDGNEQLGSFRVTTTHLIKHGKISRKREIIKSND